MRENEIIHSKFHNAGAFAVFRRNGLLNYRRRLFSENCSKSGEFFQRIANYFHVAEKGILFILNVYPFVRLYLDIKAEEIPLQDRKTNALNGL